MTVNLRSTPPNVRVDAHTHPWAQLAFPIHGALQVAAAGMSWIVPAFRAVWIPPHIEHEVAMLGQVDLRTLYIHAEATPLPLDACVVVELSPLLHILIDALGEGGNDRRAQLMMQLILEEIRVAPPLSLGLALPRDRRLKALCDAIMDDPAATRQLSDYAREIGASARTLARLFKTEMNTSFGAWRQQLRLARAIDAIGRGQSMEQIAAEVGYANPAAFSTMFKRSLGVPPSRFSRTQVQR